MAYLCQRLCRRMREGARRGEGWEQSLLFVVAGDLWEKELDAGVGKMLRYCHTLQISQCILIFSYLLAGWGEVRYGKKIKHGPRSARPEPLSHSLLAECCQSKHGGCYCRGHVHTVEIILPNEPAFKATVNGGSNNLEERFLWHTHTHILHTRSENMQPHMHMYPCI